MPRYASQTTVSSEKSRNEIERMLTKYGADSFMYGWETGRAVIAFRMSDRHIRFNLPMPERQSDEFRLTPTKYLERSDVDAERAYEQAVRQRWRALALCIKAKLEAVEAGIVEFETEFLAHVVMPNGRTVGELALPQLEESYAKGESRLMLLPG